LVALKSTYPDYTSIERTFGNLEVAPFLESTVTFTITPNATGGTCLRIVHELTDARFDGMARAAANSNSPPLRLAA
jgi:uncharacterized protein YndB with AHSA1/START domain